MPSISARGLGLAVMAVPTDRTTRHPEPSTAALCKPHKSVRIFISITVGNISPDHQVGVVSRSQSTNLTSPLEMFLPCWEQSRNRAPRAVRLSVAATSRQDGLLKSEASHGKSSASQSPLRPLVDGGTVAAMGRLSVLCGQGLWWLCQLSRLLGTTDACRLRRRVDVQR
jgi:hypothetical protein